MQLKLSEKSCKHEPDESTKTFDTMKGWSATCKHCGAKLWLVRLNEHPRRDRPKGQSKKERRRVRRAIKEATREQQ